MNSIILKMAVRTLKPLFVVVSVWLLLRGHNHPGGGFIGGLIAGSALIFDPLADDELLLSRKDETGTNAFLTLGLLLVLISALTGLFLQGSILDGQWIKLSMTQIQYTLKLGTPLLFDIGVFFTVIGFIKLIFISKMEEWLWN